MARVADIMRTALKLMWLLKEGPLSRMVIAKKLNADRAIKLTPFEVKDVIDRGILSGDLMEENSLIGINLEMLDGTKPCAENSSKPGKKKKCAYIKGKAGVAKGAANGKQAQIRQNAARMLNLDEGPKYAYEILQSLNAAFSGDKKYSLSLLTSIIKRSVQKGYLAVDINNGLVYGLRANGTRILGKRGKKLAKPEKSLSLDSAQWIIPSLPNIIKPKKAAATIKRKSECLSLDSAQWIIPSLPNIIKPKKVAAAIKCKSECLSLDSAQWIIPSLPNIIKPKKRKRAVIKRKPAAIKRKRAAMPRKRAAAAKPKLKGKFRNNWKYNDYQMDRQYNAAKKLAIDKNQDIKFVLVRKKSSSQTVETVSSKNSKFRNAVSSVELLRRRRKNKNNDKRQSEKSTSHSSSSSDEEEDANDAQLVNAGIMEFCNKKRNLRKKQDNNYVGLYCSRDSSDVYGGIFNQFASNADDCSDHDVLDDIGFLHSLYKNEDSVDNIANNKASNTKAANIKASKHVANIKHDSNDGQM